MPAQSTPKLDERSDVTLALGEADDRSSDVATRELDVFPAGRNGDAGELLGPRAAGQRRRIGAELQRLRWVGLVYLGTRVLLLLVAFLDSVLRHHSLSNELAHWDGRWYGGLANHGYPGHVSHLQSTLGFFPLYPMVIWLVSHVFFWWSAHNPVLAITVAGVVVSGIGGLVATVLVQRLAAGWWGELTGRRAAALFCLFPGSVVFSMVYAEGLGIPLAVACILALQHRRWLLAGVLAGFATACEPEALVLVVVCFTSALLELRRSGWRAVQARRSLLAPLLSLAGVAAFALYLWARTGTPFAYMLAQRYGWGSKTGPFALVHLMERLADEISFSHFNHPTINLNLVVGLVGAILLIGLLVLLFRTRRSISVEAIVWTLGIGLLAITTENTPPNPRLLITAFPAVLVIARYVKGRTYCWLVWVTGALLAGMSVLTFVGPTLRP